MIEEDDLTFLRQPHLWPRWPLCPIKRSKGSGWPDFAVVSEVGFTGKFLIFEGGNIFDPDSLKEGREITPDQIIQEGWVVD